MKKVITLVASIIIITTAVQSQNDFLVSQFMLNPLSFSPAYCGKGTDINVALVARQQWVGFDGAPSTQIFNIDAKIFRRHGIGLSVFNDMLGNEKTINIKLMYAYHIKVTRTANLSVSAGIGLLNHTLDDSKIKFDPKHNQDVKEFNLPSSLIANFDFGLLFYTQRLSVGLSSKYLDKGIDGSTFAKHPRHYYLMADYRFRLNDKFDLIPSVLVRSTLYATQFEVNFNLHWKNKVWGGLSYRSWDQAVIMAGLFIKNIRVGYAFDYSFGPLFGKNVGSHEIFVSYSFNFFRGEKIYMKNPRMFN